MHSFLELEKSQGRHAELIIPTSNNEMKATSSQKPPFLNLTKGDSQEALGMTRSFQVTEKPISMKLSFNFWMQKILRNENCPLQKRLQ